MVLERAVRRIRVAFEQLNPRVAYVLFSAGKDSSAALLATLEALGWDASRVVIVYNEIAGNTARVNVDAFRATMRRVGIREIRVVLSRNELQRVTRDAVLRGEGGFAVHIVATGPRGEDYAALVERWGPPPVLPAGKRWCTRALKAKYWDALAAKESWPRPIRVTIDGVKRADSRRRGALLDRVTDDHPYTAHITGRIMHYAIHPLYDYSDAEVRAILRDYGLEEISALYDAYNDSLNCIFCPFKRVEKLARILGALRGTRDEEKASRICAALTRMDREKLRRLSRQVYENWMRACKEARYV